MVPLLVLAAALLALWGWGVWNRQGTASFMASWVHVPLIASVLVLLLAAGTLLR